MEEQRLTAGDVGQIDIEQIRAQNPGTVTEEGGKVIVSASADLTGSGQLGGHKSPRAKVLEEAASTAVLIALREGHSISDSATILAYKRWAMAYAKVHILKEPVEIPPKPDPLMPPEA